MAARTEGRERERERQRKGTLKKTRMVERTTRMTKDEISTVDRSKAVRQLQKVQKRDRGLLS